jgi:antitoxin HicB
MNFKNNLARSRFSFPVTLKTDEVDGGFTVTFRDLPEAITQGENIEDAFNEATDCLEEAIANRVLRCLPIPS